MSSEEITSKQAVACPLDDYDGLHKITFKKIGKVGVGAFGNILLCEKPNGEKVVLKKVQLNDEAINEAKLLVTLQHPNIVTAMEVFRSERSLYIVLEWMQGGDLRELIRKRAGKPFQDATVLSYATQLADALNYIHARDVIHRDVKTMNCLLNEDHSVMKLGDFGISVQLEEGETTTRGRLGTANYMAPEMLEGKDYDKAVDMWAMGCVLYEMVELKLTFTGSSDLAVHHRICTGSYSPSDHVLFGPLIQVLLSRSPSSRLSAASFLSQLIAINGQ